MLPLPRAGWFTIWVLSAAVLVGVASGVPQIERLGDSRTWAKTEFRVTGVPAVSNPFDPDVIRVDATFVSPSGRQLTVPAFWYQPFEAGEVQGAEQLSPAGEAEWRVRFTATEPGRHELRLNVVLAGQSPQSAVISWSATAGTSADWVRIRPGETTFSLGDKPLLLSGHNVCWPGLRGAAQYDDWFREMAAAGQNLARLWLAPWWAGLEHVPGTLTNYRLDAAWQLDQVFAAAEEQGLYVLLCLDHHGMYQPIDPTWGGSNAYWRTNPYSSEQGGPCAHPSEFFKLPAAKAAYQKRLRYLIARYGYSPRLLAWQFFNEIDNIFDRAPVDEATVVAWHVEMARWLRANDPYQHVIGTSLTGGVDRPAFWQLPEMEFTSYHAYWEPAPARRMGALASDFAERYGKPALIGEFGVSGAHWDAPSDPHLRGFRQHLWGGTLGGAATVPLAWWWDDVHADGGLALEQVLSDALRTVGWYDGGFTPVRFVGAAPTPPKSLSNPTPDAAPFNASLALNPFRRLRLDGAFAVANPLAAERASEFVSAVLWGSREPEAQRPLRLQVWAGPNARLVTRVAETTGPAALVQRLDGREVLRQPFTNAGVVAKEYSLTLPEGRRTIEIANDGPERLQLAALRFEGLLPAAYADHWEYSPEALGLRRDGRAILYVVAPAAVYPAGAIRYRLPEVRGAELRIADWPERGARVRWINPETGATMAEETTEAENGVLRLEIPPFSDDLVAILEAQ